MLLTKEGEVNLARRIERGKKAILKGLIRTPLLLEEIDTVEKKIKHDPTFLREIFDFTEDEIKGEKNGERLKVITDMMT